MASPRARSSARLAAASLACAAVLTGCGGDGEAPTPARDHELTIAMRDYFFSPQAALAAPGKLTITLVNDGRVPHNFRLRRNGRLYAEVTALKPGERETHAYDLPAGGYRMFCSIANHEELGMYGSLTVR